MLLHGRWHLFSFLLLLKYIKAPSILNICNLQLHISQCRTASIQNSNFKTVLVVIVLCLCSVKFPITLVIILFRRRCSSPVCLHLENILDIGAMANNVQIISKQKNYSTPNDSINSKVTYYKRKHFKRSENHKKDVSKTSQYSGSLNVSIKPDLYLEPNKIKSPNSSHLSQHWYDDIPLSQSSELHLGQKYEDYSQECGTRDIGTMTEDIKDTELEKKCNELFGKIVACEISNIKGNDRFNKMKEILDVLQNIKL